MADKWPLSEVASTLDARPRDVLLASKALGFAARRLNEKVNREQALEIRSYIDRQKGKQERKILAWMQKNESSLRAAAKRQELEKKCEEDRLQNRAVRDPKEIRPSRITGMVPRKVSDKKRQRYEKIQRERTESSKRKLDELRGRQRRLAQGKNNREITSIQAIGQIERLEGNELINKCLNGNKNGDHETSICIKAGYKTDNIGQFRRAFSKAANVPFGPLVRMIADLRRKEFQVKERVKQHLDDQAKIVIEETSISTEEESEELIAERRTVEVRSTTRVRNTRFRNAVLKAHGYKCACCGIDIPELLEAAHIVPVANDGTDHPSNGIALCPTHHSAFDRNYFTFEPGSRKLVLKAGLTTSQLLITKETLEADINDECLALRQRLFNTEARY